MTAFDPTTVDVDAAVRAGAAVYNVGEFHAAHDAWEDRWLDLAEGTDDERLLHGLIQFTAAVHHARGRNWEGATGLAESATDYLADLPADYRGLDLGEVREYLTALRADPERVERSSPPTLTVDGEPVVPMDLRLDEAALAATAVAEEYAYDESVVADAVRFAREQSDPGSSRYATFLRDFVGDEQHRSVVFERLADLVERERRKEEDVTGLFDEGDDGA